MATYETMTAEKLNHWVSSDKSFILVDVNPNEYFEAKHIPNAVNACVYEMAFLDTVKKLVATKEKPIVVYSASDQCMASTVAAERLVDAGYSDIYKYPGGLEEWEAKGRKVVGNNFTFWEEEKKLRTPEDNTYNVDSSKSILEWAGRNMNSTHTGTMKISEGEIEIKKGSVVRGNITIDMNSMNCSDISDETTSKMLITHLKSDDFFSVDKYAEARFSVTSTQSISGYTPGSYNFIVKGDLTMKDVTKRVEFPAIINGNKDGILVFLAQVDIDRTDWNVLYGSGKFFQNLGMHLVNDIISIQFRVVYRETRER